MAKNNIRSIRFSDEIAELIDRQIGDTFTQKFESLVTRCTWELPAKEEQLKTIQATIEEERKKLQQLRKKTWELENTLRDLTEKIKPLKTAIDRATKEWS